MYNEERNGGAYLSNYTASHTWRPWSHVIFIVCPWYGISAVRTVCAVLCTPTAERPNSFVCAAGSGNRKNKLRSKQDLHQITLWHNLWLNTAAFWVLKGKWAVFRPALFDPECGTRWVCALYCDGQVLAIFGLWLYKQRGNYMYHVLLHSGTLYFASRMLLCVAGSLWHYVFPDKIL